MIFPPNLADNSGEKYEGQWMDGKMAGYGKLRWIHCTHYKLWCKLEIVFTIAAPAFDILFIGCVFNTKIVYTTAEK